MLVYTAEIMRWRSPRSLTGLSSEEDLEGMSEDTSGGETTGDEVKLWLWSKHTGAACFSYIIRRRSGRLFCLASTVFGEIVVVNFHYIKAPNKMIVCIIIGYDL